MMGVGFGQAIRDAGPDMLLELARLAQGRSDLVLYVAGAVLAALVAWPIGRRTPGRP
jgi:vitamin B12 transport system permease protein